MRTLKAFVYGATLVILAYTLWRPTLAWALTRIPPQTPHEWTPKMRTSRGGTWTDGPWDNNE